MGQWQNSDTDDCVCVCNLVFFCRADYQKISQRLKERKHPPPIPGNVAPENRPSLVGGVTPQLRDRSDTVLRLPPTPPPGASVPTTYDVSGVVYTGLSGQSSLGISICRYPIV